MRELTVGIDFGTSIVKATALDCRSGECTQISNAYQDLQEKSTPRGWSSVLERTLREIISRLSKPYVIRSLAITAMVPNIALVDRTGSTLGSLLFCDDDAYVLERELDNRLKSPKWANEVLSKILHLKSLAGRSDYKWFSTHNWLVNELTGAFVIDAVTAGECGSLVDAGIGWRKSLMDEFNLPAESFPRIVAPVDIVGNVKGTYAVEEVRGVPVVAGTSDTVATALGAGWADERDTLLIYYGTFNSAARIHPGKVQVLRSALPANPFEWILSVPRSGTQLAHMADLLSHGETIDARLSNLDSLASASTPGAGGVVFLHADNIGSTTVSSRPRGSVRYLEPHHTRADLARSVLEGFAYLLRWSLSREHLHPDSFPAVLAAGGGARSQLWRQIVSDVSGLTQSYRPSADRGLGSALLGLSAVSLEQAVHLSVKIDEETQVTKPQNHSDYDAAYQRYIDAWC